MWRLVTHDSLSRLSIVELLFAEITTTYLASATVVAINDYTLLVSTRYLSGQESIAENRLPTKLTLVICSANGCSSKENEGRA